MKVRRRSGFTLIELLIVVAIIAILALIAVPNFLEAQTRAKVSRAKSDMRTLVTAEEAYFVDWNSYTQGVGGDLPPEGFVKLTTPVAYITTIPPDPFGWTKYSGSRRWPKYEFGVGNKDGPAGRNPNNPGPGWPADTFELESDGPDHADDTGGTTVDGRSAILPSTGGFPTTWMNIDPQRIANGFYDPTNGTVSSGEIFRTGGQNYGTPSLSLLWTLSGR